MNIEWKAENYVLGLIYIMSHISKHAARVKCFDIPIAGNYLARYYWFDYQAGGLYTFLGHQYLSMLFGMLRHYFLLFLLMGQILNEV